MKRTITTLALLAGLGLFLAPASVAAHEGNGGNVGVGLGIGSPTAFTLAVAPVPWSAFELSLGLPAINEGDTYAHLVYDLNVVRLAQGPSVVVPVYLGLGGYVRDRGYTDGGARFPAGVNFDFQRVPLQLFAEAALEVTVASDVYVGHPVSLVGFGGARFWL
jgi:hypothetical protein